MSSLISAERMSCSLAATPKAGHGPLGFLEGDWQERLAFIDQMMQT